MGQRRKRERRGADRQGANKQGAVKGTVIYVLALVVLVQTIYPITVGNGVAPLILYQFLYGLLMVAGILVARESPIYLRLLVALGIIWMVVGVVYTFNQTAVWALLAGYGVLIVFQGMVTVVLLRYIFTARTVDRDVLYAASAVYLLLGAIFVPAYGIVETVTFITTGGQHAFVDGAVAAGAIFPWQNFVYYSYATLTTLGYGDVLPVTLWARSLASLEAIVGVLYVTVILARLVGLYASRQMVGEEAEG